MRKVLLTIFGLMLLALPASAQTADEIVAKYIKAIGGIEKIQAVKTMRTTSKFNGGGGFEAVTIDETKRPNMTRSEFQIQGMVGVSAFDGKNGWKIEPWQGKKDAESMSEEEIKPFFDDDFDDPLISYKQKNIKLEYLGIEPFEGSDTYKLKLTYPSGTIKTYYMDTDYYVPIKIETKRFIRGAEQESETVLGDYKQVGGVYYPHSFESGAKGSPNKAKVTIEKIEINVPLDESRFGRPAVKSSNQPTGKTQEDVNMPKTQEKKTDPADVKKPPVKR